MLKYIDWCRQLIALDDISEVRYNDSGDKNDDK